MKWMLIIAAFGYAGAPVVSVQVFENESLCKAAIKVLSQQTFAGLFGRAPTYQCVELKP